MLLPSKIICAGLNYKDHAKEMGLTIPDEPVLFMKSPTALIGDGDKIIYPSATKELHYEAELAIVILENGKLGYTCANDVTARDLQRKDGQWTRAKSFNTFCPVGPKVVTDIDPNNLDIKLLLNGEIKQHSNTRQMIFNPAFLVKFILEIMPLFPGDIILTGTPPGIGPMQRGDTVEVVIEGIGTLKNTVA